MPATEIARGSDAIRRVNRLMESPSRLVFRHQTAGEVTLYPGNMFGADRIFITVHHSGVAFVVDDTLYTQSRAEFVGDRLLIALSDGARRAAWCVPMAHATTTFAMAFVGSVIGVVATIGAVSVGIAKAYVFYHQNKQLIENTTPHMRSVLECLNYFREHCPALFWLLTREGSWEAVVSAGQGVSTTDLFTQAFNNTQDTLGLLDWAKRHHQ